MVIVKVRAAPTHEPTTGVTVIVAVCCVVTLADVKLKSPEPLAAKPMSVLEFVQLYVVPAIFDAKTLEIGAFPQAVIFDGCVNVGTFSTVILKVMGVPVQPLRLGVTVILAIWVVLLLVIVKFKLPVPLAARPIEVLSFVHEYVAVAWLPLKFTARF